ncbi:hypothetical protein Fmac_027276 [Flemingia macrophylla]|uniref:Zinc finger PHD-type domain-containing protein n=1 Tax=Flemingia macrophylla TaxID=520843 RepID=A0ABD1LHA5_9FABA
MHRNPFRNQLENPKGASNMTEDEVLACDICGDAGVEKDLAICSKCTDGAQHIYCMRNVLDKVPDGWMCEDCMESECQKSQSLVNFESSRSSKTADVKTKAIVGRYVPISQRTPENGATYVKNEKSTVSLNKTLISGSNGSRLDAVQRDGQLDSRLPPKENSHEAQKDLNCLMLNSVKEENEDVVKSLALDLNANPGDGNGIVEVHEAGEFGGTRSSHDRILLDGKVATAESVLDPNIPRSATPEGCPSLSVGNVGDKPINDVKDKTPIVEDNNAGNVMLRGKLPTDEKSDAERPEYPTQPSLPIVQPTCYEETLDQLDWKAVEALISLSKGLGKL